MSPPCVTHEGADEGGEHGIGDRQHSGGVGQRAAEALVVAELPVGELEAHAHDEDAAQVRLPEDRERG